MEPTNDQSVPSLGSEPTAPAPSLLTPPSVPALTSTSKTGSGSKLLPVMMLVATVILSVVLLAGFWMIRPQTTKTTDPNATINSGEYQALFLTNGQVYFGKLSGLGEKYVSLKNIYYLQISGQNLQSGGSGTNSSSNSQVSLAKLGNELHGPEDKMSVSSDQVLFWENLKNDSKVVQAIAKYQSQQH